MLIGSLNRETSLLLPLVPLSAYLITRGKPGSRAFLQLTIVGALVAVSVTILLRTVGPGPASGRVMSLGETWRLNAEADALGTTLTNVTLVFGALVLLAAYAIHKRSAPLMALITALTVGSTTLAIWLVFALWWEVRVLGPLLVVLLPVAIAGLCGPPSGTPVRAAT